MAQPVLETGRNVLVLYDGENLWHERLLIVACPLKTFRRVTATPGAMLSASAWWILTPDGDVYPEELGERAIRGLAICNDRGVATNVERFRGPAVGLNNRHSFAANRRAGLPTPLFYLRVRQSCLDENAADEVEPEPMTLGTSESWTVVLGPERLVGTSVSQLGTEAKVLSNVALQKVDSETVVLEKLKVTDGLAGSQFKVIREPTTGFGDDRIFPVSFDTRGDRYLEWRRIVELGGDHKWHDFPIEGPPTAYFCVKHMYEHGGGSLSHHNRFVGDGRLQPSDPGINALEVVSRALKFAVEYDQLNVCQLASFELLFRYVQMVHMKYRERFLGKSAPGNVENDMHWYLGTSQTRGRLCISPKLTQWISEQQHNEAMIYKERRKLEEERRLLHKNKGAKEKEEP